MLSSRFQLHISNAAICSIIELQFFLGGWVASHNFLSRSCSSVALSPCCPQRCCTRISFSHSSRTSGFLVLFDSAIILHLVYSTSPTCSSMANPLLRASSTITNPGAASSTGITPREILPCAAKIAIIEACQPVSLCIAVKPVSLS